jgi:hypothetical protein
MSRHRTTVLAAVLLLAGVLLWQATRIGPEAPPPLANGAPAAPAAAAANTSEAPRRPDAAPPERSTLVDALNAPDTDIRADLRLVSEILDTFRTNFLQTGNPTGTNAEITAALTGQNRLRLALIPPDHPAINREGELCDRWGTPFFFHAESATRMDIRSAGPDRKMWNEDDVVLSP